MPVGALVASGLVLTESAPAAATAAFTAGTPERLYMTPAGVSLPNGVAEFVGVKVGTLQFDGSIDPISQDVRSISVQSPNGPLGCNPIDQPGGGNDYDIDDCSRLYLDVSHGHLRSGTVATNLFRDDPQGNDNPADPVYRYPSGAILDGFGGGVGGTTNPNSPDGFTHLEIVGTQTAINTTLQDLVYVPDAGYHYAGSFNAENLLLTIVSGDPNDATPTANRTVQIRVLDVNGFPAHDGPDTKTAVPETELVMTSEFTVADEDNDEVIDGAQATPPVAEEPIPDGEGQQMLLIGWLDCTQPTIPVQTGFHFQGGTFLADAADIEDLLVDFYDPAADPATQPFVEQGIDAVLAGLEAIEPGITTVPLATNSPFVYTDMFAGISDIGEIAYALDEVTFLHDAPSDVCTLVTIVSDLGNNGLPLQFLGSPPNGVELPFLGFDVNVLDISVGDPLEVDVSFQPGSLLVTEGGAATATLAISPAEHPAFDVRFSTTELAGEATGGADYAEVTAQTITIPENATSVDHVSTGTIDDAVANEGNEAFQFVLTTPTDPPPGPFVRPFGWVVNAAQPIKNVIIVDNDGGGGDPSVSVDDVSLAEGNAGTSTMTFTLLLDAPAAGGETVDVDTADGTATVVGNDYEAVASTVTFGPGATTATVQVTVNGDTAVESNETFTLNLTNPVGLTDGDVQGVGTITNDDAAPVQSVVSIADGSVTEGANASTTISMTNPAGRTCSVSVTSADGTAVAPGDYDDFQGGTFNLVNVASDVLSLSAVDDDLVEGPEIYTLTIALLPASNPACVLGDANATVTITSDDVASVVSIADGSVTEGANASTTISMTNPAGRTCSVSVTSADGTAVAPGDYDDFQGGTFNLVNVASDVLGLSANDDAAVEGVETYTLTIALLPASDGQCTLGDSTATVLIVDADSPPDVTPPSVTIDQAVTQVDPTSVSPVVFTVTFSEPVTGFVTGDVSLSGSAGATTGLVTPVSSSVYTVSVGGMGVSGTVVASVGAGVAVDAANNPSAASTSTDNSVQYNVPAPDVTPPSVTINQSAAQVDPTSVEPIAFRVDFSEPVTGFVTGDVLVSGSAGATTALVTPVSSSVYAVSVSGMTVSGTVVVSLGAGVAVDVANNPSAASTSTDNSVQYNLPAPDVTPPSVTIEQAGGQADPTSAAPIAFTVTFSEPVTGFVPDDVTVTGTAGANAVGIVGTGPVYTVTVDGMTQSGTVIVTIAAGVVTDAAANPNTASTSVDNVVAYAPTAGPLTLALPGTVTRSNDPGQAGAIVTYPTVTATGGVPPVSVVCTPASGTFFALGSTTVTCVATDADSAQNQGDAIVTGTFLVSVVDAESPVIADLPDLARTTFGTTTVPVSFPLPGATDNSGVAPTVTCSPQSGSAFSIGSTTVTCTAVDGAGNSASSSFVVAVASSGSGGLGPLPTTGGSVGTLLVSALILVGVGLALQVPRRRLPR